MSIGILAQQPTSFALEDTETSNPSSSQSTSPIPGSKESSKELDELGVNKQRHSSGDAAALSKIQSGFRSIPSTPLKLTKYVLM